MHIVEIKEDPKTKELFIEFPDELVKDLDWKENDTLVWTELSDGSWSIKKKE